MILANHSLLKIYVISETSRISDLTVLDIINIKSYNIKNFPFLKVKRNNRVLKDDTLNNTIVKKFYLFCIQHSESHHIKYNELLVVWDIYYTSRRKKHLRENKLRNFFLHLLCGLNYPLHINFLIPFYTKNILRCKNLDNPTKKPPLRFIFSEIICIFA